MSFGVRSRSSGASDPSATKGYPIKLNAAKTCFLDQNEEPCFLSGENAGFMVNALSTADIELYLADRESRGFNAVIIGAVFRTQANFNGDAPYNGSPYTNFNTAYWSSGPGSLKDIIARCQRRNITVLLNPWFSGLDDASGDHSQFYNASTALQSGFGTFIGNLCKDCPNIIYPLGGDSDPNNAALYAALDRFATALRAADPGHLITFEAARTLEGQSYGSAPNSGYSSYEASVVAFGSKPAWLDFNSLYQTGATIGAGARRCVGQGSMPLVVWEDEYEGQHSTTPQFVRQEGYTGVLGGGALGRNFGTAKIYPFSTGWQADLASVGSVGQSLLARLFRSRRHWLLVTDSGGSVMTVGAANGSYCARENEGRTIIAYLPSNQTVTIDMSKIADVGSQAKCWWFDPTNGSTSVIGTFSTSGTRNFTPSGNNAGGDADWVLVIDSNAAGLGAPGT